MFALARVLSSGTRPFGRRPGFALTVIATLALGIAPNCVIFAIMDAVYFRPLPYPAQEELVLLNVTEKDATTPRPADAYSFDEWRRQSRSFEALAAYRNAGFNLTAGSRPERIAGQRVTAEFFSVLRSIPERGRLVAAADCEPGAPPVVVLSHQAWVEQFDGRADIVNLSVRLNGVPATVVGVMPASFTSFMEGRAARAWAPLVIEPGNAPGTAEANVIGRLKRGIGAGQAQGEVSAIQASLAARFPEVLRERRVVVRDFRAALFGGLGPGLRMLTVVVGLLLVIACANAANLLLGRSAERVRDVALRSAIGATRLRLTVAQLGESLCLAAAAAGSGLLLAWWVTQMVWAHAAPMFVRIGVTRIGVDGRVALFALALTAITVVLFGVGPALAGSRADVAEVLKAGARGSGRGRRAGRVSRALVVGQVALCVVTLVVAALMTRGFLHFATLSTNPGFDPAPFVVGALPPPEQSPDTPASRLAMLGEVESGLAAAPGVDQVVMTSHLPFLESGQPAVVSRGSHAPASAATIDAELRAVNEHYLAATSAQIVRGRGLTAQDGSAGAPVAVIDERLASAAWGTANPVGDRLVVAGKPRTIVGVVRLRAAPSPFRPPSRELFVPYKQAEPAEMKLMVRSHLAADAAAAAVRGAVAAVDADQPVSALQPLAASLDDFMSPFRLILGLITLFGATALSLAGLGLYSVIARGVARRTREIGVRMAMGAARSDILALVLREGLRSATTGLIIGLLLGLAVGRLLPAGILGVSSLAPWHYLAAVLVWLAAALAACAFPARRAAAVEPIAALRCD